MMYILIKGSFGFSAFKCPNCIDGYLLPKNSLDYNSIWICSPCSFVRQNDDIEKMVDEIEEHLNDINTSGQFERYSAFIETYSDVLLHKNHYLIMTAAR